MDLPELYRFFARYVPVEVLRKNHVSGQTPDQGAEQLQHEVLTDPSDERIDSICDFLFLGDQDFVLERLRNSNGQLLFLDSDRIDFAPDADNGVTMQLGLTVAEHYNASNASVVSELTVQNRCLETLQRLLRSVTRATADDCSACFSVTGTYEIRFFDAKQLNGLIGYTAFFSISAPSFS